MDGGSGLVAWPQGLPPSRPPPPPQGKPPLEYRWFKDQKELNFDDTCQSPELVISDAGPSDSGYYFCVVSNDGRLLPLWDWKWETAIGSALRLLGSCVPA